AITREEKKVKSAASVTRRRKTKKGQPVNDNPESAQ
ncbi:phage repressor protein C1, partial [Escherichia coli]